MRTVLLHKRCLIQSLPWLIDMPQFLPQRSPFPETFLLYRQCFLQSTVVDSCISIQAATFCVSTDSALLPVRKFIWVSHLITENSISVLPFFVTLYVLSTLLNFSYMIDRCLSVMLSKKVLSQICHFHICQKYVPLFFFKLHYILKYIPVKVTSRVLSKVAQVVALLICFFHVPVLNLGWYFILSDNNSFHVLSNSSFTNHATTQYYVG
jgi:hypothetical protein